MSTKKEARHMKVLPDYLIKYMPLIEEAMEELRLSIIDHSYDLLKRLDIDELSSDEIRKKLELYHIKLENMTSDWLPNGKFYRIYPLIKHNRTRYNAIQSIIKSGGQFEGLWSDDFSTKKELDYYDIQLLRHYYIKSDLDGYFFVSGDATRNKDGTIKSSVVTALSTDALLEQALPAGYTYLYIPWPRPLYPADSDYFYNIFSLQYDRLHYAIDCNNPNSHYYDLSVPASVHYYNNDTRRQSPYWYDYHYITSSENPYITYWPINKFKWHYYDNKGKEIAYIDALFNISNYNYTYTVYKIYNDLEVPVSEIITDEDEIKDLINKSVRCELDESCSVLNNSNSYFITRCILNILSKSSAPNRDQEFTPKESVYNLEITYFDEDQYDLAKSVIENILNISENKSDVEYILNEISENHSYILSCSTYKSANYIKYTLDSYNNLFTTNDIVEGFLIRSIDEFYTKDDHIPEYICGPYRYDYLAPKYVLQIFEDNSHFKTYRPLWDAPSTIFGIAQSSFKTTLEGYSNNSMINVFNLKQDNNMPKVCEDSIYGKSFIKDNIPPVSEVTYTSFDRPIYGRLDPIYTAFFNPSSLDQESNVTLDNDTINNKIYTYNSQTPIKYDPRLYYTITSLGSYDSQSNSQTNIDDISLYIEGDPVTGNLYINKYNQTSSDFNEISYKTSLVHKMWFSNDKSNTTLNISGDEESRKLYNRSGASLNISYYSANKVNLVCKVLGIYTEDGKLISKDGIELSYAVKNNQYMMFYTVSKSISASYVLFTVEAQSGSVPYITVITTVEVYNQSTNYYNSSAQYMPDLGMINPDGVSYITMTEFYNRGYIIVSGTDNNLYFGNTNISLYYDDNAQ